MGMQGAEKFSIFSCKVHVKQNKFDKGGKAWGLRAFKYKIWLPKGPSTVPQGPKCLADCKIFPASTSIIVQPVGFLELFQITTYRLGAP